MSPSKHSAEPVVKGIRAGGHIRGFDGLRGISIIMVILTHYGLSDHLPDDPFIRERLWALCSGTTGVNIFFTLSGLLITRILLAERERKGHIDLKRFYIRRFLRLMPPFLLFLLLTGLCAAAGLIQVRPIGMLVSLLYLYDFMPRFISDSQLSHTWTLAVEEQFYLLWPFLMSRMVRSRLVRVAILLIALAVIASYVLPGITMWYKGEPYPLPRLFSIERWFLPAAGPIMIGALAALLAQAYPGQFIQWGKRTWPLVLAAFLYACPLYVSQALLPLCPLFQAMGIAILLLHIIQCQRSLLTGILDLASLAYFGKISYGVYLFHVLIISTGPDEAMIASFPLSLIVFMGISIASYEFYEKPILRLKQRFE